MSKKVTFHVIPGKKYRIGIHCSNKDRKNYPMISSGEATPYVYWSYGDANVPLIWIEEEITARDDTIILHASDESADLYFNDDILVMTDIKAKKFVLSDERVQRQLGKMQGCEECEHLPSWPVGMVTYNVPYWDEQADKQNEERREKNNER